MIDLNNLGLNLDVAQAALIEIPNGLYEATIREVRFEMKLNEQTGEEEAWRYRIRCAFKVGNATAVLPLDYYLSAKAIAAGFFVRFLLAAGVKPEDVGEVGNSPAKMGAALTEKKVRIVVNNARGFPQAKLFERREESRRIM